MLKGLRSGIRKYDVSQNGKTRFITSWSLWVKIGSSLGLIVLMLLFMMRYRDGSESFHTDYGEHLTVVLPDNSRVTMNGNSFLRYNYPRSNGQPREVWMKGEVFFDISPLAGQNFIVHTDEGVDVNTIGTKFNVKVRRGRTEVMLEEGHVKVDLKKCSETEITTLRPGELVINEGSRFLKFNVNPSEYSGWKDHRLYFSETTLLEVGNMLEDTYGARVTFEDSYLPNKKLSGEIWSRKLSDILAAVEASLNIKVSQQGSIVVFHSESYSNKDYRYIEHKF